MSIKKLFTISAALIMAASLTACGGSSKPAQTTANAETGNQETVAAGETTAEENQGANEVSYTIVDPEEEFVLFSDDKFTVRHRYSSFEDRYDLGGEFDNNTDTAVGIYSENYVVNGVEVDEYDFLGVAEPNAKDVHWFMAYYTDEQIDSIEFDMYFAVVEITPNGDGSRSINELEEIERVRVSITYDRVTGAIEAEHEYLTSHGTGTVIIDGISFGIPCNMYGDIDPSLVFDLLNNYGDLKLVAIDGDEHKEFKDSGITIFSEEDMGGDVYGIEVILTDETPETYVHTFPIGAALDDDMKMFLTFAGYEKVEDGHYWATFPGDNDESYTFELFFENDILVRMMLLS